MITPAHMIITKKPWLAGLIQGLSVFCFTLLIYFIFSEIIRFNSSPYRVVNPVIVTTTSVIAFVFVVIMYALIVFAYPLYLFSKKMIADSIKTVAFTALFLLIGFVIAESCIYFFANKMSLSSRGQSSNPSVLMSNEDVLLKAEEAKTKSENARLEYQSQLDNKPMPAKIINLAPENKIYPYAIDINTGEQTPINP